MPSTLENLKGQIALGSSVCPSTRPSVRVSVQKIDTVLKGGRALRGYFGPPMRSKNKSCFSQVSSY